MWRTLHILEKLHEFADFGSLSLGNSRILHPQLLLCLSWFLSLCKCFCTNCNGKCRKGKNFILHVKDILVVL